MNRIWNSPRVSLRPSLFLYYTSAGRKATRRHHCIRGYKIQHWCQTFATGFATSNT